MEDRTIRDRLREWTRVARRRLRGSSGIPAAFPAAVLTIGALWQGLGAHDLPVWLLLPLLGLLWSLGVAASSVLPSGGFVIACGWLAWHGIVFMGPWAGHPWAGLPVLWLLLAGLAKLAWQHHRWKIREWVLWGIFSMGAASLSSGPTGWTNLLGLPPDWIWAGTLLSGLMLFAAGILARGLIRRLPWTHPGFWKILAGSMTVMAVGLGSSAWRDLPAATGWSWSVVEALTGWAAIAWFVCGGAFAVGLIAVIQKAGTAITGKIPQASRRIWHLPLIWLGVTAAEWLIPRIIPDGAEGVSRQAAGFRQTQSILPIFHAHRWVGVVVLVLAAGFLRQGRDGLRLLPGLNALWITAFAGMAAAGSALLAGLPIPGSTGSTVGSTAILIIGVGWLMIRLHHEHRKTCLLTQTNKPPAPAPWAVLALLTGSVWVVAGGLDPEWSSFAGPAAFLGMLHPALPVVLHWWWTGGRNQENGLSLPLHGTLIAAGLAGVLLILPKAPFQTAQLALSPLFWLPVLLWLRWYRPLLDTPAGALAGGLLGTTTAAAWCRPDLLLPEIPLIFWLNVPPEVLARAGSTGDRPWIDPLHFSLLLILGAAGAVLGALVFRDREGTAAPLMPLLNNPQDALVPPPPSR